MNYRHDPSSSDLAVEFLSFSTFWQSCSSDCPALSPPVRPHGDGGGGSQRAAAQPGDVMCCVVLLCSGSWWIQLSCEALLDLKRESFLIKSNSCDNYKCEIVGVRRMHSMYIYASQRKWQLN